MHLLTIVVFVLVTITVVKSATFEESRFISEFVLSDTLSRTLISCVGHCLQNPECSAVRFTRPHRHCQLFLDVLWLYGSEILPLDPDVVEYKMVKCSCFEVISFILRIESCASSVFFVYNLIPFLLFEFNPTKGYNDFILYVTNDFALVLYIIIYVY